MMRHLTAVDFRTVPWVNGRGQTVEMARRDDAAGMVWRFSRAAVVEDGEFSLFPGIDRSLTVLTGPGFDLVGVGRTRARPLVPVGFAGDVAIRAEAVTGPCEDFNVMVRRGTDLRVEVVEAGRVRGAVFALGEVEAGGCLLGRYDLLLTEGAVEVLGPAILVEMVL